MKFLSKTHIKNILLLFKELDYTKVMIFSPMNTKSHMLIEIILFSEIILLTFTLKVPKPRVN